MTKAFKEMTDFPKGMTGILFALGNHVMVESTV